VVGTSLVKWYDLPLLNESVGTSLVKWYELPFLNEGVGASLVKLCGMRLLHIV
jgi:hypothetical protein